MSELTCTCRRYGYPSPLCPRHGTLKAHRLIAAAAYFVLVVIAVVLTGSGAA